MDYDYPANAEKLTAGVWADEAADAIAYLGPPYHPLGGPDKPTEQPEFAEANTTLIQSDLTIVAQPLGTQLAQTGQSVLKRAANMAALRHPNLL